MKDTKTGTRRSLKAPSASSQLFSIAQWLIEESRNLAEGKPEPDPRLITDGWPYVAPSKDGDIALTIHGQHEPWTFDAAIAAFLAVVTAVTGSIGLNAVGDDEERKRLHFPYLRCGNIKVPVDRITLDAQPGQSVPDPHGDFHDRRAAKLRLENGTAQDRPTRFRLGREDAIQAALTGYDVEARKRRLPIGRESFEAFLRFALWLHDKRHPKQG